MAKIIQAHIDPYNCTKKTKNKLRSAKLESSGTFYTSASRKSVYMIYVFGTMRGSTHAISLFEITQVYCRTYSCICGLT